MSALAASRARDSVPVLVVACPLTVALLVASLTGPPRVSLTAIGLAVVAVAAWVTAVHPLAVFRAFAVLLALLPYADVPGTDVPLLLVLCAGIWAASLFLPGVRWEPGWPEAAFALLALVAGLSVVATGPTPGALLEYAAWLAATSVVLPIRVLPARARAAFVQAFVLGCAVAAVVGIVLLLVDPLGLLLGKLSFVGYAPHEANAQYVLGTEENALRLTGTFVEPNIAGLVLAVGLLLAVATTSGTRRVMLAGVIGAALVLTLSRSALGTVAVAAVLLVLVSHGRRRTALIASAAAASVLAVAVPTVRDRLLNSFGPNDTGTLARQLAFENFTQSLQGHWWWGLGWDREEYRDPAVGVTVNYVANAPLFTAYRGGVLLAALAGLVLVALVIASLRLTRRGFEQAVLGTGVAAFCLVALQLDFPVVIQHPATAVFSVLVGLTLVRHEQH